MAAQEKIRGCVAELLRQRGDPDAFTDADALVSTGRLDSLDVMDLVAFLETSFGVDFSSLDFDVTRFESVDAMAALVERHKPAS